MNDEIEAEGIRATVNRDCGMMTFRVTDLGREVAMLHRAPWVGTAESRAEGVAPHLAQLEGDFFCAPFADASADGAPLHGWPANAAWEFLGASRKGGDVTGRWRLSRPAIGAVVGRELTVADGPPFLYQRHVLVGGAGRMPVANHAMLRLPSGGIIRTSPKRIFVTPENPQESDPARGRSALRYPAEAGDPRRFPKADGGTADLLAYPFDTGHEDFVIAVEAPGHALGWTAVVRPAEGDLFVALRDARVLPLTMFWHSNGGRHSAPWSSRHKGVLGVEEGIGFDDGGFLPQALRAAMLADGQPTAVELRAGRMTEVRHVLGQIAWPSGEPVVSVSLSGGMVRVTGEAGTRRDLPVLEGFLPKGG